MKAKLSDYYKIRVSFNTEILPLEAPLTALEKTHQQQVLDKVNYKLEVASIWIEKFLNSALDDLYNDVNPNPYTEI